MQSMKFIQNYHNEHTKIEFGMLIVVILYEFHTSHFAVYQLYKNSQGYGIQLTTNRRLASKNTICGVADSN